MPLKPSRNTSTSVFTRRRVVSVTTAGAGYVYNSARYPISVSNRTRLKYDVTNLNALM